MLKKITRSKDRGYFDYGWLKTFHTFSFSSYYNTERMNFGKLRVLNDDTIAPATGFDLHPHDNMEIITIPFTGELRHGDSEGHTQVIKPGDVQVMSAGSGIRHSEFNNLETDSVNLFQIWIFPKERNINPRYDQKTFNSADRQNKFQLIASSDKNSGNLWINQDAWLWLANISRDMSQNYNLKQNGNGIFIINIEGKISVADEILDKRDSIELQDVSEIEIKALEDSEILLIEVPMK